MKKLTTLLFVLVFAGATAFAQNNTATVGQTGNDNDATVTQAGADNSGDITQDATLGNGNFATIDQLTSDNDATIGQVGNSDAEITQMGGNGNSADISQDGTFDRTYNSYGQTIRNYYGIISQDGALNDADIIQVGGSGAVEITQTGDENIAVHDQGTDGYGKTYIGATITQNGLSNEAYQDKQSTGGVMSMDITQTGDDNVANQDLSQDRYLQGNNMDIIQTGNLNEATQTVWSLDAWGVSGNAFTITQTGGDYNIAVQTANDNSNTLGITQTGSFNDATQTAVTAGNMSTVTQAGSGNVAVTLQQ